MEMTGFFLFLGVLREISFEWGIDFSQVGPTHHLYTFVNKSNSQMIE